MLQFIGPLLTSIIGGVVQGAINSSGTKDAAAANRQAAHDAKVKARQAQLKTGPREGMLMSAPVQADQGSRLAQQDPAVRSQALDALRARMNQGA